MHISSENMAIYKATAQRRKEKEEKQLSERYHHAWEIARKGAELLKKQFKAKEVILFGSLIRKELFHRKSDVDLAVQGLDKKFYYRAVSRLLDLDADIQTDLVMIEDAVESLRKQIEKEGMVI
jgi:predicted nucleotidyltransferase